MEIKKARSPESLNREEWNSLLNNYSKERKREIESGVNLE